MIKKSLMIQKKYIITCSVIVSLIFGVMKHDMIASDNLYEELKVTLETQEKIIDYSKEDDKVYALISKNRRLGYGDKLAIYTMGEKEKWERIYESDFADLKPWKIEIADMDGNGEKEILIAVNKTTHFDQYEKNRMFIFNYNGEKLYKKWTGSQIAGVWKDFYAEELLSIPGCEMIFIEKMMNEKERISIYYWFDFGFVLLASSESYQNIKNISILGENSIQITCSVEQKEVSILLMVKDGKIIETIMEP